LVISGREVFEFPTKKEIRLEYGTVLQRFYENVREISKREKKLLKLVSIKRKEIFKKSRLYLIHPLNKKTTFAFSKNLSIYGY